MKEINSRAVRWPWLVCPQGKYTTFNGDIYQGDWVSDEKTGKGRQTFRTTGCREGGEHGQRQEWYDGDWLGGKMQGKGDSSGLFCFQRCTRSTRAGFVQHRQRGVLCFTVGRNRTFFVVVLKKSRGYPPPVPSIRADATTRPCRRRVPPVQRRGVHRRLV